MIYYKEEQKFWKQWWFKALYFGIILFEVVLMALFEGFDDFGDGGDLVTVGIMLLLGLLFWSLRLTVILDSEGIRYRFVPLINKERQIPWTDVAGVYIRKYSPLAEYGGWGIRYGKGTAYNVSGNIGLQLITTGNKRILFGTQQQQALAAALEQLHAENALTAGQLAKP